jgi:transcriptional regulator with XRE-family HTH domain
VINGESLANARRKKGWSQMELARKLGVNKFTISKAERGLEVIGEEKVKRLAALLGVSMGELAAATVIREPSPGYGADPMRELLGRLDQLTRQIALLQETCGGIKVTQEGYGARLSALEKRLQSEEARSREVERGV